MKKGDRVTRGQRLGRVGNSGNTSEPHLHLHAVRGGTGLGDGEGVPVTFGGRFLLRNDFWAGRPSSPGHNPTDLPAHGAPGGRASPVPR